jgi:parallel beta-helix repeat protein
MATLTYYVTGAGSAAVLSKNTGTYNWQAVDDGETPDDDATYVYGTGAAYASDLYSPRRWMGCGAITNVTLYIRCKYGSTSGKAKTYCKVGGTAYTGPTEHTLTNSYANYSQSYATSPKTGLAWTWAEVIAMEIGVSLYSTNARCTEVWAVVTYTPDASTITYSSDTTLTAMVVLPASTTVVVNSGVTVTRDAALVEMLFYGPSGGCTISGAGTIDGNRANADAGEQPIMLLLGAGNTVTGISDSNRLTITGNRHTGVAIYNPSGATTVKWTDVSDCYSTAAIDTEKLGVGILVYGYSGAPSTHTGVHISYCDVERSGLHGIQVLDCDAPEIDHCVVDGVYANFGVSVYGDSAAFTGANVHDCTISNSRAESINFTNGDGAILCDDNTCINTRADFGITLWLCPATGGYARRCSVTNAYADGIAIVASSGFTLNANTITNCGEGGDHHAGILVEPDDTDDSHNNVVSNNIIRDTGGEDSHLFFGIKEIHAGGKYAYDNTYADNTVLGYRVLPVHLATAVAGHDVSTQSGNGMD